MTQTFLLIMTVLGQPLVMEPMFPAFDSRKECREFGEYMERVLSKSYLIRLDDIAYRCEPKK